MRNEQEKPTVSSPTCTALLFDACGFEIKHPLGKQFDCTNNKTYCASCFMDKAMLGKIKLISDDALDT